MSSVFVTRNIPGPALVMLENKGYEVRVSEKEGVLSRGELLTALRERPYDALLSLLTDKIDAELLAAVPSLKIVANYAVGYDNIDLDAARSKNIFVTNTPGVLVNAVAEHSAALMFAVAKRIVEADSFIRAGNYAGWDPMLLLGSELRGKTVGILGLGRIGSRFAHLVRGGLDMNVVYYDVARNEQFEKEFGAQYRANVEGVLREADVVSVHVPLLPSTRHLINRERLALMKKTAILINTSRGPVVDEAALVEALRGKMILGAGLDVYEFEPKLADGLAALPNVVLTPHTASATDEARNEMSKLAALNVIAALSGEIPPNNVL